MAMDGIAIAALAKELNDDLAGGRIAKIQQTESDELILTIKTAHETSRGRQTKLLLSADASLPLVFLTSEKKKAPDTAPSFCMLLRKHLTNGKIVSVTQPALERVIRMTVDHLDEMGYPKTKTLLIELMGKHSNIILIDDEEKIVDAIKHIGLSVSSVREVLPGKDYFIPDTMRKSDPLSADTVSFAKRITSAQMPLFKALYTCYTGVSPVIAQEICYRAGVDPDSNATALTYETIRALTDTFFSCMREVTDGTFSPEIVYVGGIPKEFSAIPLTSYRGDGESVRFDSMSALVETYYAEKQAIVRNRQKSTDLKHVIDTTLERTVRKYDQQKKQIADTEKKEKFRLYGELLTVYAHEVNPKEKKVVLEDYNTGDKVTIPLDPQLSATENAQKYYAKYNKMKRTYETLSELTKDVYGEIEFLKSAKYELENARSEEDLSHIREELVVGGYLKRKTAVKQRRKEAPVSKPLHYLTSDGFDLYVGRNNLQNDEITFKLANGSDWWFHAKGMPGSHVILRTGGKELPDRAFEEAAGVAAYYSSVKDAGKAEVDYLQRRDVKKPNGAKPGYVIYYTNYSMTVAPSVDSVTLAKDQ